MTSLNNNTRRSLYIRLFTLLIFVFSCLSYSSVANADKKDSDSVQLSPPVFPLPYDPSENFIQKTEKNVSRSQEAKCPEDYECVQSISCINGAEAEYIEDTRCTLPRRCLRCPDTRDVLPICGNRVLEGIEACDDGNTMNGDGCSSTCTIEISSQTQQQVCTVSVSGGGTIQVGQTATITATTSCSTASGEKEGQFLMCVDAIFGVKEAWAEDYITSESLITNPKSSIDPTNEDYDWSLSGPASMLSSGGNNATIRCDQPGVVRVAISRGHISGKASNNSVQVVCVAAPAVCGNGTREGTEGCDDGNVSSGDGCSSACQLESSSSICVNHSDCASGYCDSSTHRCSNPICGDGVAHGTEQCGEPSLGACPQAGYICQNCLCQDSTPGCGDGIAQAGEECGDRNLSACPSGNVCVNCRCEKVPECGDNVIDAGETCGEPGLAACSSGYSCHDVFCKCIPEPTCGNGVEDIGEECGDGTLSCPSGQQCNSSCHCQSPSPCGNGVVDSGESCGESGLPACASGTVCRDCQCYSTAPICGDGLAEQSKGEECGEPNLWTCTGPQQCKNCRCFNPPPVCGNGFAETGEVCGEPGLQACPAGKLCNRCLCVQAPCGNGTKETGEECDDGNIANNDGCSSLCKTEKCGDGTVQSGIGEECDDSNTTNSDGCSSTCKTEKCGDGVKQSTEGCDDGNTTLGDGCDDKCKLEYCGDGKHQTGLNEQCDDGNTTNADGCSSTCQLEAMQCSAQCTATVAGNGTISGNCAMTLNPTSNATIDLTLTTTTGTVCAIGSDSSTSFTSQCNQLVNAASCTLNISAQPQGYSSCTNSVTVQCPGTCGNGAADTGEQCDDGNLSSGDGCSSTCQNESLTCTTYLNCNSSCAVIGGNPNYELENACGPNNNLWVKLGNGRCQCLPADCIQRQCFTA